MVLEQSWMVCITESTHYKYKILCLETSTPWHSLTQKAEFLQFWRKINFFWDQNKKCQETSYSPCPTWNGDVDRLEGPHCSQGAQGTRGSWHNARYLRTCSIHGVPQYPCGRAAVCWECFSSWFRRSLPLETQTGRKQHRLLVLWTIETDWHFPIKFPISCQNNKRWFQRKVKVFKEK